METIPALQILMGLVFIIGYAAIALEHRWRINKSGTAILLGGVLWVLAAFDERAENIGHVITEGSGEIFSIIVFLLSAMTIVEVLLHYRLFDWIRERIMKRSFSSTGLFWVLGVITFVLSAVLDNLTTTLIMLQIGRKIYRDKENFLLFAANTVVAANAGGAASPIGDVTTIMLWISGKFTAIEILSQGILPALMTWLVPQFLLARKVTAHEAAQDAHPEFDIVDEAKVKPYWSIIAVGLFAFVLPVVFNIMGLPPFLGILMGVGSLWVFLDINTRDGDDHAQNGSLIKLLQRIDIATLKFFIGVLLAVGALAHVGVLQSVNNFLFGETLEIGRLVFGNVVLGFVSSVLDNVPLVAAAMQMFPAATPSAIWVLLALTAGTGGSLLIVGSAAGVAAMGQVEGLTFGYYLRRITLPVLLGYLAAVGLWCLMFLPRLL